MPKKLNDALVEKAESMGWIWRDYADGSIELENWSPAGENLIVSLYEEDVILEMRRYANDFDPDEHAGMLVENRGKRGVPNSIRTLIDDADEIKKMLETLADAFEEVEKTLRYGHRLSANPGVWKCIHCGKYSRIKMRIDERGVPFAECQECGSIHEERSWYRSVSQEQADKIIENREPEGLFVLDTGNEIIGIDNSTGDAWTEEFPDLTECLLWLAGEKEAEDD